MYTVHRVLHSPERKTEQREKVVKLSISGWRRKLSREHVLFKSTLCPKIWNIHFKKTNLGTKRPWNKDHLPMKVGEMFDEFNHGWLLENVRAHAFCFLKNIVKYFLITQKLVVLAIKRTFTYIFKNISQQLQVLKMLTFINHILTSSWGSVLPP